MDAQLWHEYCMTQPPPEPRRVTVREWNAMSDRDREIHVERLEAWLYSLFMPTADVNGIFSKITKIVRIKHVDATRCEESASALGTELRRQEHDDDAVGPRQVPCRHR